MKVIQIDSVGAASITDLPAPQPGPDQVVLQVQSSGLCHTDFDILHGHYSGSLPVVPGHEFSGVVTTTGSNVKDFSKGDRVAVDPLLPCCHCVHCKRDEINLCANFGAYGLTKPGAFAPFVAVNARNCHDIGELPFPVAALAEPFACVLHGIDRLRPQTGQSAVIFGAGPIGLMMMLGLRDRGVAEITLIDLEESRLEFATDLGATAVSTSPPNHQFDIGVDCSGVTSVCEQLPGMTRSGGSILFFGVCAPGDQVKVSPSEMFRRELTIVGSHSLKRNIPDALRVLNTNREAVHRLVSHEISLEEMLVQLTHPQKAERMKTQVRF